MELAMAWKGKYKKNPRLATPINRPLKGGGT